MENNYFNQTAYLERINYSGETSVSLETLKALQHAQFFTIPFENFDIHLGRAIELEPSALFHKLVQMNRGGYCFELNGLFLMALKSLGFDARPLLGRVHLTGTPTGRGHQISLITLQGNQWIADVGFGANTPRAPIQLMMDQPSTHFGQTIRLTESDQFGIMLQSLQDGQWQNLYSFDLGFVYPGDIKYGNYYTSTHPDSFFTNARVAALPSMDGGVTLMNTTIKRSGGGKAAMEELEEGQAYIDSLKSIFGIDLNVTYDALLPIQ